MIIKSRYGDERTIENNGHGWYTMSGRARFTRGGMNEDNTKLDYFDSEGGPFVQVGDNLGFGKILYIETAKSEPGTFKIRIEVET
jgi:hypothetical protein